MGKFFSKSSAKSIKSEDTKVPISSQSIPHQEEQFEIYDPNKYDLEAVDALKTEFSENPDMFVLNLLLMSFMFFDDYQKEIRLLANLASERGQRLNSKLIEKHQKQMLTPDSVLESVNRRVKFRPLRESESAVEEPLVRQRMFILHDTIEIEDRKDNADYSRIDKPCYRASIEESKENKGFVKVNILGAVGNHSTNNENWSSSADSLPSTSTKRFHRKKSEISPENKNDFEGPSTAARGNDSGFDTAESDYDYIRITAARTPKKLHISEKDIYTNINQLPSTCITDVKVKNDDSESDSDEDDEDFPKRKQNLKEANLFRIRRYLNSTEFMSHFKNNVFPNYLGDVLGFSNKSINGATSISSSVYCDTVDDVENMMQWEIIPTIPMPWPDEIAFEWTLRRRRTVWDKREKKPIAYKWPTPKMVEEANKLNCVVVPKGFMPKKGENSNMHIEWEVGFPKAEKYLELRMSHAQMRIYLFILILHKKFMEPLTQKHGLLIDHVRVLMFWECEANYKAWAEDKLGIKLQLVLKTLYEALGKKQLSHYFIRSKNVLENVPGKYLRLNQEVIHRILESPLPHFLSALRHLRYQSEKFYPPPDLDELYNILTSNTAFNADAHLSIIAQQKAKLEEEAKRKHEDRPRRGREDKEQKWNRRYLEQQRHANAKKLMKNIEDNPENLTSEEKESKESTDMNFSLNNKTFTKDTARHILLLTFFIKHFFLIAKKSSKISTTNQTLFYLKQAWYLTMLLEPIDYESALEFQKLISDEEQICQRKKITEPKIPTTPKRNSNQFAFKSPDILQVKGKEINITNLSKSYNAMSISTEPRSSPSVANKKNKKTQLKHNPSEEEENKKKQTTQTSDGKEDIQLKHNTQDLETRKLVSYKNDDQDIESEEENETKQTNSQNVKQTSGDKKEIQFKQNTPNSGTRKYVSFRNEDQGMESEEENKNKQTNNQNATQTSEGKEEIQLKQYTPDSGAIKYISLRNKDQGIDLGENSDDLETTDL